MSAPCGDAGVSPAVSSLQCAVCSLQCAVFGSNVHPHCVLWGRGRLARGGFAVSVMDAARQLQTAHCKLQTANYLKRVSYKCKSAYGAYSAARGFRYAPPPSRILAPLRGLKTSWTSWTLCEALCSAAPCHSSAPAPLTTLHAGTSRPPHPKIRDKGGIRLTLPGKYGKIPTWLSRRIH